MCVERPGLRLRSSICHRIKTGFGSIQVPVKSLLGWYISLGKNRVKRENDHSSLSITNIKNILSYSSISQNVIV
jgi:hypothetical protein